ncbi:MAG: hypothetical protein ACRDHZ_00395 [Ktedonobacteraceae bacterium]
MDRENILAEALGQAATLEDWQRTTKDGFVVEVKIKHWRARKKLTLYELGVLPPNGEAAEAYESLLNLGTNALLPMQTLKNLESIERQARLHLKTCTFETPFGRFLPYTAYIAWKNGNALYKQRFLTMRDQIVESYPNLVNDLLVQYEQIAKHTYFLLNEQHDLQGDASFVGTFPNEESFIQHFRTNLIACHIKPAEEFAESFVYEERFNCIQLDGLVINREKIEEPETWLSEQGAKQAAALKRRELLLEMERDLVSQARAQKKNMIDQFLESLLIQTRTITYDAVTSVLASIQREETLQGRPVIQLKALIEKIQQLNFYQDNDIDRMLTSLHSIIEKPAKERDLAEIQRQLRAIATLSRATVLALGDEAPRTEKEINPTDIGISAFPTDEEVREAREEIALVRKAQSNQVEESREERVEDEVVKPLGQEVREEEMQRVERES